jgi:hypothetical protein
MEDIIGTTLDAIIASINKLHGGERDQRAKHADYVNFLENNKRKIIPSRPGRQSDGN